MDAYQQRQVATIAGAPAYTPSRSADASHRDGAPMSNE